MGTWLNLLQRKKEYDLSVELKSNETYSLSAKGEFDDYPVNAWVDGEYVGDVREGLAFDGAEGQELTLTSIGKPKIDWVKLEKGEPTPYSIAPEEVDYDTLTDTIFKTELGLKLRSSEGNRDKLFLEDGLWKVDRRIDGDESSLTILPEPYIEVLDEEYQDKFNNVLSFKDKSYVYFVDGLETDISVKAKSNSWYRDYKAGKLIDSTRSRVVEVEQTIGGVVIAVSDIETITNNNETWISENASVLESLAESITLKVWSSDVSTALDEAKTYTDSVLTVYDNNIMAEFNKVGLGGNQTGYTKLDIDGLEVDNSNIGTWTRIQADGLKIVRKSDNVQIGGVMVVDGEVQNVAGVITNPVDPRFYAKVGEVTESGQLVKSFMLYDRTLDSYANAFLGIHSYDLMAHINADKNLHIRAWDSDPSKDTFMTLGSGVVRIATQGLMDGAGTPVNTSGVEVFPWGAHLFGNSYSPTKLGIYMTSPSSGYPYFSSPTSTGDSMKKLWHEGNLPIQSGTWAPSLYGVSITSQTFSGMFLDWSARYERLGNYVKINIHIKRSQTSFYAEWYTISLPIPSSSNKGKAMLKMEFSGYDYSLYNPKSHLAYVEPGSSLIRLKRHAEKSVTDVSPYELVSEMDLMITGGYYIDE